MQNIAQVARGLARSIFGEVFSAPAALLLADLTSRWPKGRLGGASAGPASVCITSSPSQSMVLAGLSFRGDILRRLHERSASVYAAGLVTALPWGTCTVMLLQHCRGLAAACFFITEKILSSASTAVALSCIELTRRPGVGRYHG